MSRSIAWEEHGKMRGVSSEAIERESEREEMAREKIRKGRQREEKKERDISKSLKLFCFLC